MASTPKFIDRIVASSTTTGTGTYTLGSAITGFQAWSALGDGNSAYYYAEEVDSDGNPSGGWEVGVGTYTSAGTTLSRDRIIASSNSNNAVNWAAGTRRIALTVPAEFTPPLIPSYGIPLKGAQFRRLMTVVNIGDTDLYTVPTGKLAFVGGAVIYNNGAGNITAFGQVKVSGTYYRLTSNSSALTPASAANLSINTILKAGDILAINTITSNGLNVTAQIVEFDSDGSVVVGRVLGPSSGDNTLYTCPTGKTASLISMTGTATLIAGNAIFVADSGGARTIIYNLVPSGDSPGNANKIAASASVSASTRATTPTTLTACFGAGDFFNINVDTGNAAQYAAALFYEIPAF